MWLCVLRHIHSVCPTANQSDTSASDPQCVVMQGLELLLYADNTQLYMCSLTTTPYTLQAVIVCLRGETCEGFDPLRVYEGEIMRGSQSRRRKATGHAQRFWKADEANRFRLIQFNSDLRL